jgi:hypothetical protein
MTFFSIFKSFLFILKNILSRLSNNPLSRDLIPYNLRRAKQKIMHIQQQRQQQQQ